MVMGGQMPWHGTAGRHRVDQGDVTALVEDPLLTAVGVNGHDAQRPVGPGVVGQPSGDDRQPCRFGDGVGVEGHGPDRFPELEGTGGGRNRVDPELFEAGQVERRGQLAGASGRFHLASEQVFERDTAGDLGGNGRTGGGADDQVRSGDIHATVGQAGQNPGLPGDASHPTAAKDQRPGGHGPANAVLAVWAATCRPARYPNVTPWAMVAPPEG